MSRRRGQVGQIVAKGSQWHVRFYTDEPRQQARVRRSLPVGPRLGKDKLTKSEAARKGAEMIQMLGINSAEHLARALAADVWTFRKQVDWCRENKRAWTEGRPGPVKTMESQLNKHILPELGDLPLSEVTDRRVQEFIAKLRKTTFERRKPAGKGRQLTGEVIKTYKLSRKTIASIIGVVKLVVGKKAWVTWELDLGRPQKPRQRYYTRQEMMAIIELAEGQFKVLFSLLAGSGVRIGEACGLCVEDIDLENGVIYVRRSFSETANRMLPPKTENSEREIDIDPSLVEVLRAHLETSAITTGLLFRAANGSPLRGSNIIKRVLNPILDELGIPRGGKVNHAFRHGRVTELRRHDVPGDLQKAWIGHSSLRTTDNYSHLDEDKEYRRAYASKLGLTVQ